MALIDTYAPYSTKNLKDEGELELNNPSKVKDKYGNEYNGD